MRDRKEMLIDMLMYLEGEKELITREYLSEELEWAVRAARLYPAEWREARSAINHDYDIELTTDTLSRIYNRMRDWKAAHGYRSWIFNTLIRVLSIAKLTQNQVTDIIGRASYDPPAFDPLMRYTETKETMDMRHKMENIISKRKCKGVNRILDKGREIVDRLIGGTNRSYYVLSNGSSTGMQHMGQNVIDIMGNVLKPEGVELYGRFKNIIAMFGLLNDYSEDNEMIWLSVDKGTYDITGGEIVHIPDKDAKIREVYMMHPWIQIISKSAHYWFDRIAKGLEGNYTYGHRDWIRNIISKGWHQTKYIVSTDITKFSDTLDRSFILFILKEMGFPESVLSELDDLYSMPIIDKTRRKLYKDTMATYQGQYGDFPLITIANLVIQELIYYIAGQPKGKGYCAAVGDDTGLVFDECLENLMDIIEMCYAAAGMNISRYKTSIMDRGKGRIEFVKLNVDSEGIIPFINPRSFLEGGIDQIVREVFDMEWLPKDMIYNIFARIFDDESAKRLTELSIINGGISDHIIQEEDVLLFVNRLIRVRELLGRETTDLEAWLDKVDTLLRENGYDLSDTSLVGFLNKEGIELLQRDESRDVSDLIKMTILNTYKLGFSCKFKHHPSVMIGHKPSDLKYHYNLPESHPDRVRYKAELWAQIESYESEEAVRKRKESKLNRKVSTYESLMKGYMSFPVSHSILQYLGYHGYYPSDMVEFRRVQMDYSLARDRIALENAIEAILGPISVTHWGYNYIYPLMEWNGEKYRLYDVTYNSKYPQIPDQAIELLNQGMGTRLTRLDIMARFNQGSRSQIWKDFMDSANSIF